MLTTLRGALVLAFVCLRCLSHPLHSYGGNRAGKALFYRAVSFVVQLLPDRLKFKLLNRCANGCNPIIGIAALFPVCFPLAGENPSAAPILSEIIPLCPKTGLNGWLSAALKTIFVSSS